MRLVPAALGLLALSSLLAFVVHRDGDVAAGTAVQLDLGQLTQRAELVVEGRVLSALPLEHPDGRIETEYLLDVARTHKGEDQSLRALRLPGGHLPDGRGLLLAGMPRLEVGEELLLFLSAPSEGGTRMPVGLAQGKFRVLRGAGGAKFLVRDSAGLTLVRPDAAPGHGNGALVLAYAEALARMEAGREGPEAPR